MAIDPNVAAALISGGAGLTGSIAGNLFNIGSVQETNRANMQIAKDQRDFYKQMWMKENQYNTPSAQMQRLSAAGLNPSLMYGEGAGGLPASATINPYDAPRMVAPTVNPMESAQIANIAADTMLKKSEAELNQGRDRREGELQPFTIENLKANSAELGQRVVLMTAQEKDIYQNWTFKSTELAISRDSADAQINLWNKEADKMHFEKLKSAEEYRQLVALYELKEEGIRLTNREIQSRIHVNEADAKRLEKMLDVMDSEIYLNNANAQLAEGNDYRASELLQFDKDLKRDQAATQRAQASLFAEQEERSKYGYLGSEMRGATRAGFRGYRSMFKKEFYQ